MRTAVTTRRHLAGRVVKTMESTSLCELEKYKKAATMPDSSLYPNVSLKGYTIEEIREIGYDKLSAHYGVDIRKL